MPRAKINPLIVLLIFAVAGFACLLAITAGVVGAKLLVTPQHASAPPETPPPVTEREAAFLENLAKTQSSLEHHKAMVAMRDRMQAVGYDVPQGVLIGTTHAEKSSVRLGNIDWRIPAYGWDEHDPDSIPVAFMKVRREGVVDRDWVDGAGVEFAGITQGTPIGAANLRAISHDAVTKFADVRSEPLPEFGISWEAKSGLYAAGDYRIRMELTQWPADDESGPAARLMIYILYLRPDLNVDLEEVRNSGFRL